MPIFMCDLFLLGMQIVQYKYLLLRSLELFIR